MRGCARIDDMSILSERLDHVEAERADLIAQLSRGGFSDMEWDARQNLLLKKRALLAAIRARIAQEDRGVA